MKTPNTPKTVSTRSEIRGVEMPDDMFAINSLKNDLIPYLREVFKRVSENIPGVTYLLKPYYKDLQFDDPVNCENALNVSLEEGSVYNGYFEIHSDEKILEMNFETVVSRKAIQEIYAKLGKKLKEEHDSLKRVEIISLLAPFDHANKKQAGGELVTAYKNAMKFFD